MPPKRRSSFGGNDRKRKKAARLNESEEQHEQRIQQVCVQTRLVRDNESQQNRELRLEKDRVAHAAAILDETHEQRAQRLEQDRVAHAAAILDETHEQRAQRLEQDRVAHAAAIVDEQLEERAQRLEQDRVAHAAAIVDETHEQQAQRLEQNRVAHAAAILDETHEQRAQRLEQDRVAHAVTRSIVPPLTDTELIPIYSIGQMTESCQFCMAQRFPAEARNCCANGKVTLDPLEFPEVMKQLLCNRTFLQHIRRYNSAFAFASLGANFTPPPGLGPYCFRIHGQIYHRSGSLHPTPGQQRTYGQVYILEGNEAVEARMVQNVECDPDIMLRIQAVMDEVNPFAAAYRHMYKVEQDEIDRAGVAGEAPNNVKMVFKTGRDHRRYNEPLHDEVAAIFIADEGAPPGNHDIVVYPEAAPLHRISYLNAKCDPMIYPLLFPTGSLGWDRGIPHNTARRTAIRQTVSQLEYYSYRLAVREDFSPLFRAGKLFHQYLVDAYVKVESQRLDFIRQNQATLRVERYQGLMDHVNTEALNRGLQPGKVVILPSSFPGSPRAMQQNYQDAMAVVTKFGRPDLFLTFTCNPRSPDIVDNLFQGQQPGDRPDLICRVFHMQLAALMQDIKVNAVLGKTVANIHVIEFQKRGLPHCHLLIWLAQNSKLHTAEDVDRLICAEIPDRQSQPRLFDIITSTMIHGPCGILNTHNSCMQDGKCTKDFPKEFVNETAICDNGYPRYRRRDNGVTVCVRGKHLDNRWVVPYSPVLSARYGSHINLEACMSIKSVKYIFKYVYKGHDCAQIEATEVDTYTHDEVSTFLDARYVSAPEAMWRLSKYDMHQHSHTVMRLAVHLPEQQAVYFQPGHEAQAVDRAAETDTHLTAWFRLNTQEPNARELLYTAIPKHYVFDTKQRKWTPRKRGGQKVIVRMYAASPADREKFCLRLLLLHVPGATSFEYLRTVQGEIKDTFHAACLASGLLTDDRQWDAALREASTLQMPRQCRQLFVTILTHCEPADPRALWDAHCESLSEDFTRDMTPDQAIQHALADINDRLLMSGHTTDHFGLPIPEVNQPVDGIDIGQEEALAARDMEVLNLKQREAVDCILDHVDTDTENDITAPRIYFLDGPGGTGKTMVYNTLIAAVRSRGKQVAACAWTGIASTLLRYGRTVHNLFKLPVPVLDTSTCNVTPTSDHATMIRALDLILIDEASMVPTHALHAIDRLLRDLMNTDVPLGGKLILLGGDFRQVLPVVPRGGPTAVIEQCLKRSHLWAHVKTFQLEENMRAGEGEREFAQWLLRLGNAELRSSVDDAPEGSIDIPDECICRQDIVDTIYPDFTLDRSQHVILTPKNDASLTLSDRVLERVDGLAVVYLSQDTARCDEEEEAQNYSPEFLHSITPTGMPQHQLTLKEGATIMLLRNLDSKRGLCNGARLTIRKLYGTLIDAELLTGTNRGDRVLIPRVKLAPSDANLPFTLERIQFPVRLSYVMTINKSQGQTFDKVGLYLPSPVFSHGQLYVAFSRARAFRDVTVAIEQDTNQGTFDGHTVTTNVVYKDIL